MVSTHIMAFRRESLGRRQRTFRRCVEYPTEESMESEREEEAEIASEKSPHPTGNVPPAHSVRTEVRSKLDPSVSAQRPSGPAALPGSALSQNIMPARSVHTIKRRNIFRQHESKVSFSDNVKIKLIPFYSEYGAESIGEMWWSKADYKMFQQVAIAFVKMYGSLKNIKDEDHMHDEPMLILNHHSIRPAVRSCSFECEVSS
mmetsp:Transcript_5910/g.9543  ORF Transcript_5910/g.9543 Transcript_5910/m.9543 type:complete len:202 (-) Transcript_5910:740-1345(-)